MFQVDPPDLSKTSKGVIVVQSPLLPGSRGQGFPKCGPQTSSIIITGERIFLGFPEDALNQKLLVVLRDTQV